MSGASSLPDMPAVEVSSLRRTFVSKRSGDAELVALDGVDLSVEEGEIHGLLGPNGAGKTTLVKILATILIPTSGRAAVLGHDVVTETEAVRRAIGLVFGGDRGLYTRLTARRNLEYWAALYDVPPHMTTRTVDGLLERVGLASRADDRVEGFSRGMKQRLHLARGLVGDPRVIFLDEPTVGLDPMASREFRGLVADLKAKGTTVFLTTHDLAEAEDVCDRVTLIDRGRILATESPATLGRFVSDYEWVEAREIPYEVMRRIVGVVGPGAVSELPAGGVRIQPESREAVRSVLAALVEGGVTSLRTGYPSLQEVYLRMIGDRGMEV